MNNRQQLSDAIELKRPERIPYTYEAHPETSAKLGQHLGLEEGANIADFFQCNHFTFIWSAFGWQRPRLPEREARNQSDDPNLRTDIWGKVYETRIEGGIRQTTVSKHPLAHVESIADVETYDWPTIEETIFPELPDGFELDTFKSKGVTWVWSYTNIFSQTWSMMGMEKMMMDIVLNPGIVEAVINKIVDYKYACLEAIFTRYPGLTDLVRSSDDWGAQSGLLISKEMADQYFMPHYKKMLDLAAKHGVGGYQHSCGSIKKLIPSLIEAGVKILNPIQTSADNMDPADLKREFGRDLCFHGSIDTQHTLTEGSIADVKDEVKRHIDLLGPEGFILAPSHNLQPDVPAENIVAMYEAVRELGRL